MRTVAIINPAAGRGPRLELPPGIEALETRAAGHAIELTRQAIRSGARKIVAVGGDGTINEVVSGFFENDRLISDEVVLRIIPHGTASDFVRSLNVITTGEPRAIDIMKVRYAAAADGIEQLRYSVNVTSFGIGGDVARQVKRFPRLLGPRMEFMTATFICLASFSPKNVRIHLDDSPVIDAQITTVAIGNGQYHGAGIRICPDAKLDDGLLDVTLVRELRVSEVLKSLPMLYNGRIAKHRKVRTYRAKRIRARSSENVLVELDGEAVGRLPIEVSVQPQAIRVIAP